MRHHRILKIARMGHPILAKIAKKVEDPTSQEVKEIVEDMISTLEEIGSYAGLAAPQIHIPLRIVLFTVPKDVEDSEEISLTLLINPQWEPLSQEKELGWEGCFSLPGLSGEVPRYKEIEYTYQTLEGKTLSRKAENFHARVIQHECDHLDGILYVQRMENFKKFGFSEEILRK